MFLFVVDHVFACVRVCICKLQMRHRVCVDMRYDTAKSRYRIRTSTPNNSNDNQQTQSAIQAAHFRTQPLAGVNRLR